MHSISKDSLSTFLLNASEVALWVEPISALDAGQARVLVCQRMNGIGAYALQGYSIWMLLESAQ